MLDNNVNTYQQPKKPLRKNVVLGILFFILLVGLYWAWNTSFIEVTVTNPGSGELIYKFTNQKNGKVSEVKTSSTTLKKRVSRAEHSVTVTRNDTSYLEVVKTGGFFTSTQVDAKLSPEKSRQFIGDNPSGCMTYLVPVLTSYDCSSAVGKIKIHTPATSNQPTFVQTTSNPSELEGYIEGFAKTNDGNLLLLHGSIDSEAGSAHFVYRVDNNLAVTDYKLLDGLKSDSTYSIKPYKEGFLVYNTNLKEAFYYQSFGSKPSAINLGSNKNKQLGPSHLEVSNNTVLLIYADRGDGGDSEVVIKDGNRTANYSLKNSVSSATLCGSQLLCVIDSEGLSVYRQENETKLNRLYGIRDAIKVINSENGTLVVMPDGVLNLNAAQQSGYFEYSFGDYIFNAINVDKSSYILTVTGPKGKKSALYVDPNQANSDSIDKKALALAKLPEIESLSIYGKYIYISPDLGELVFHQGLGSYDYDPAVKKTVNAKINQAISSLGINRSQYQIINAAGN